MIPFDITVADVLVRLFYFIMGATAMWHAIKFGIFRHPS